MSVAGSIYIPTFDRIGQRLLQCLTDGGVGSRSWRWYRDHGYPVRSACDVERVPRELVEECVSRLRRDWRRWIWGESVCSWFLGPAGIVIGGPAMAFVLMAWSIEMGWAYGENMDDPDKLDYLRRVVPARLLTALGFPRHLLPLTQWAQFVATIVLWGFGPEVHAADVVMAAMRTEFRHQWEIRRVQPPFTV
ncbi:MAG: hypothetical protein C7B45_12785 [Sulfobacillus acidophilus]|uniref:Uncharacterized protein n=1 Tax=Sulfobacillus acidophilus TaxID=53633 RepID=A0A2T2WFF6_9FIRM|nr:MAG: hypothetical protein C7B45_12785 [Sulfobacillus acidophilus]